MFRTFKKEEEESMTEPLLLNQDVSGNFSEEIAGIGNPNFIYDYSDHGVFFSPDNDIINPGGFEAPMFKIEYEKFPTVVNKVQRRIGGKSQQRLKANEAQVVLGIEVFDYAQVSKVDIFVVRSYSPEYHREEDRIPPQKLKADITQSSEIGQYLVSLDLDSVYDIEIPGESKARKIYGLAKNNVQQANMFYLKVVLTYVDGSKREMNTERQFQIVGKDKKSQTNASELPESNILPAHPLVGAKRPRTDTDESHGSTGSFNEDMRLRNFNPQSNTSVATNSSGYNTDIPDESVINAARIVANRIAAKKADIGELILAKPLMLKGGDIAYQFILKNPDSHPEFAEGEIVGLFIKDNGERVLDKLCHKNILDAVVKGVITRSQYLVANMQPESVRVETICMFGIVPVRVKGPVKEGEIVYASLDIPGTAVSSSTLGFKSSLNNDAAAIGVAWKEMKCDGSELNLIPCFVSITIEVLHGLMERKISSLKATVDSNFVAIYKAARKSKRMRIVCLSALAIFLLLLSILLWQVFMPGSAFRYWRCEVGSIKGHTARFKFIPLSKIVTYYWATGFEFSWKELEKKTSMLSGVSPIKVEGFHYYFNVDRCAYDTTSSSEETVKDRKGVGGPIVFAVDDNCKHPFYYSSVRQRWCPYHSARLLHCNPPRHHDHQYINITFKKCL